MEVRQNSQSSGLININTATFDEIASLSVVGDERAHTLISHRPYKSWDEIAKVPGFSKGMVESLKDSATL